MRNSQIIKEFHGGRIVNLRTTLVPFFNHNNNPNLVLKQKKPTPKWECGFSLHNRIYTKRDIQIGEELLLKYSWYDPTKPDTENNRHYIQLFQLKHFVLYYCNMIACHLPGQDILTIILQI